jgi:hypothetical protein
LSEEIKTNNNWEEKFMVISFNEKIIFREEITFEYFERFIEVGNLLKEKYHNKIIDFKLNVNGYLLYGDSLSAFFHVESFIKSILGNRDGNISSPSEPNNKL